MSSQPKNESSPTNTKCVLLQLPSTLKEAVVAEVEKRGCSMNDLIVEIAARHYGLPFQPTGRRGHPSPANEAVMVRMDRTLKDALRLDAFLRRSNLSATLTELLTESLDVGLLLPPPRRTVPFGGGPSRRKPEEGV